MSSNQKKVAELLHITSMEKGAGFGGSAAVGLLDGYPAAISWTKTDNQPMVAIMIRFRKDSLRTSPEIIKEQISHSTEILAATGKKSLNSGELKSLVTGVDYLHFQWHYTLKAPKPEQVATVTQLLLKIIKNDGAEPIGTKCEECSSNSGELYSIGGIPLSVCSGCRERMAEEDRRLIEEYQAKESAIVPGIIAGIITAAVMALLWGGTAYYAHRIFLWGAVLMGIVIAWVVNKAMGKVNNFGRGLTVLLTFASVVAGDFIFILLSASKTLKEPISMDLAKRVAANFIEIELYETNGYISILFGLIGAIYILYVNKPPIGKRAMVKIASIFVRSKAT